MRQIEIRCSLVVIAIIIIVITVTIAMAIWFFDFKVERTIETQTCKIISKETENNNGH
jgi:uncharacterized protein YpmB